MTPHLRHLERQNAIWEYFNAPRPYCRSIELERGLGGYSVQFEVSLKFSGDEASMPTIDCVSEVTAFDNGGRQVISPDIINALNIQAGEWSRRNMDELIELIEKENK